MHTNKGKKKMVMEREVIFIESDTSYDYFPAQTTSDEGSDHNPFQATSDERFDHNPFQVTSDESSDDTLKSSSKDTCSSDCRRGSSFRNAAITKPEKTKSRSKHLAPTTRTGSICTTLVVPNKRPPPVMNCVLGLAVVTTWQQILNNEFGIISSEQDVGGSSNVRSIVYERAGARRGPQGDSYWLSSDHDSTLSELLKLYCKVLSVLS
ncbi:hypothetical protein Tco_0393488 [Tanacetum coccineum]